MLHEGWAILCVTCFWGWIAATSGFIVSSFSTRGRFNPRPSGLWGGGVIIFYALWVLAMTQA